MERTHRSIIEKWMCPRRYSHIEANPNKAKSNIREIDADDSHYDPRSNSLLQDMMMLTDRGERMMQGLITLTKRVLGQQKASNGAYHEGMLMDVAA